MGFIYKITNSINNKIYIGKTTKTIKQRFKEHQKKAYDKNILNRHLYNAIRKYGINNFTIEIIEECPDEYLNQQEIFWIQYYQSTNPQTGYNMTTGGQGGNTWQFNTHKIQTGDKIRASNLKNDYVPITKESLKQDMQNGLYFYEMMKKYHCSSATLVNRFRFYFNGKSLKELRLMTNTGQFTKKEINEEQFLNDIKESILTNKEIQKKYNISETTLFNKCKQLTNTSPNKIRQKAIIKQGAPKKDISKNELLEQIQAQKTLNEIAQYFNVSKETIRRRIQEFFNSTIKEMKKNVK